MARNSSGAGLWLVVGGLVIMTMVPKEVWVVLGILAAVGVAIFILMSISGHKKAASHQVKPANTKKQISEEPTFAELIARFPQNRSKTSSKRATLGRSSSVPSASPTVAALSRADQRDDFYSTRLPSSIDSSSNSVPEAPPGFGDGCWVPPGTAVHIAGVDLPGGMIYVGARMNAPNGLPDPCLISGHLPVASVGNYRTAQMGYWPSYPEASPNERRAYLNWLSKGRSDPDCEIGYVFLFFYGLERRVLLDSRGDQSTKDDWPAIIEELRRLLAIYGENSRSFMRYAGALLSWIELDGASGQLYDKPVPDLPKSYDLPPYLRLALGQASVDRAPLPATLALAWVRLSSDTSLRTAATRCPDEFERLFIKRYYEILGPGLVLPKNRTKLKFVYQAASSGLRGTTISMDFGDVPDVTALTTPIKSLKDIADQCTDELGSYSRLLGREPSLAGFLESLLLLPTTLWPVEAQTKLNVLTDRVREGSLTVTLQELFTSLGSTEQPPTRDRVRSLAKTLESAQIGMEPDVLQGAKAPKGLDKVVLFVEPSMEVNEGPEIEYQAAILTLQLASALAEADGDFSEREIEHLRTAIDSWLHLTPAKRCRLHAHLQLLIIDPPKLTALKRKLEPLPTSARESVAAFMATLAQSDGFVSPEEVKFLEKIYKALGIEHTRLFSDVHAAGTGGGIPNRSDRTDKQDFRLNSARIAALREDTARVSALLSNIFSEEVSSPIPSSPSEEEPIHVPTSPLGLDEPHSALVRLLLSRPQWTRAELEDAASDLDLMLDGAIEQINEAAFDMFDDPICEGDDPVDVNMELLEKIEA